MNQCVALIIEKAPTLQKRNFGAKIQNGCKILSIDTYYKGKLAYPHFSAQPPDILTFNTVWYCQKFAFSGYLVLSNANPERKSNPIFTNINQEPYLSVLDRRPKVYGRRFETYGYGYGGWSFRPFLRLKVLLVVFLVFFLKWRLKCVFHYTFAI